MASPEEQVESIICGTWKFKEDKNTEECMKHMGYPDAAVEQMMKMEPEMTVERKGDTFLMDIQMVPGKHMKYTFKLGEEIDVKDTDNDPPLYHNKEMITWENGAVRLVTKSQLYGQLIIDTECLFERHGNLLHNLMSKLGDRNVIGNRIMERIE